MANRLLTKDEIAEELRKLDDMAGSQAGYFIGDDRIIRKIDGKQVLYTTTDLVLPMGVFSDRILRPLIAAPRDVVAKITQERGSVYGPFLHNAIVAQGIKAAIREFPAPFITPRKWEELPLDVREGLDYIAGKIARIVTGDPEYLDNWDDIAGFATIVAARIRKNKGL